MADQTIGRYTIKHELGKGGMATVFLGHDPNFDRDVAIKVLPKAFIHDSGFRERFEREAKVIASLEHPAIVPVYDSGTDGEQPYLVMRYMSGGSLSERLYETSLTVHEAYRIIARLAGGLDDAHQHGIIHRDLKPANILFDHYDEPYIADFGIAKLSEGSTALTGSGIIGTPMYMSPEQARGEPLDGRSDIYALGTILFEMLSGHQPYEAETPMGVAMRHITDPIPRILDVKPGLPDGCEVIIDKAMAKHREDRFQTAVDMASALGDVAQGLAVDVTRYRSKAIGAVETVSREPEEAHTMPMDSPKPTKTTKTALRTGSLSEQFKKLEQAVPKTRSEARRRAQTLLGGTLVGIAGVAALGGLLGLSPGRILWPFIFILPGMVIVYFLTRSGERWGWLAIPAPLLITLGLILLFQSITGYDRVWIYAWALLPASLGGGFFMMGKWSNKPKAAKFGLIMGRVSLIVFAVFAILAEIVSNIGEGILIRLGTLAGVAGIGVWLLRNRGEDESVDEEADRLF